MSKSLNQPNNGYYPVALYIQAFMCFSKSNCILFLYDSHVPCALARILLMASIFSTRSVVRLLIEVIMSREFLCFCDGFQYNDFSRMSVA